MIPELLSLLAEPTCHLRSSHRNREFWNRCVDCSLFIPWKVVIICDHFVPAMPSRDGSEAITSNKVQRLPFSTFDTVRIGPIIIHTHLVVFSTWGFVVD